MTSFERLAFEHLDSYVESGKFDLNTSAAIRVLFKVITERDDLKAKNDNAIKSRDMFRDIVRSFLHLEKITFCHQCLDINQSLLDKFKFDIETAQGSL